MFLSDAVRHTAALRRCYDVACRPCQPPVPLHCCRGLARPFPPAFRSWKHAAQYRYALEAGPHFWCLLHSVLPWLCFSLKLVSCPRSGGVAGLSSVLATMAAIATDSTGSVRGSLGTVRPPVHTRCFSVCRAQGAERGQAGPAEHCGAETIAGSLVPQWYWLAMAELSLCTVPGSCITSMIFQHLSPASNGL